MKIYITNTTNIKATFKGKHLSMGFSYDKDYHLIIEHEAGKNIIITDVVNPSLTCEYATIIAFFENWR